MKTKIQVVWFKRDLRVTDHAPLYNACKKGKVLCLFVVEPVVFKHHADRPSQFRFIKECLSDLRNNLHFLGLNLTLESGDVILVFEKLTTLFDIECIFSHEETGDLSSFARDRKVSSWCKTNRVSWIQYPTNGIVRGLRSRDGWSKNWHNRMASEEVPKPISPESVDSNWGLLNNDTHSVWDKYIASDSSYPNRQIGGTGYAQKYLNDFLKINCEKYVQGLSSPVTAEQACSRLSPYLALGVLSSKQVHKQIFEQVQLSRSLKKSYETNKKIQGLVALKSRLLWRCHFSQKLEMQPNMENQALHPCFSEVYNSTHSSKENLHAWKLGNTGFPFIDACVRFLRHTGWINFRMRAMLTSFSGYCLHNQWTDTAEWLRTLFIDFEPGIHYPQIQMQSGLTGINVLRVYNPIKQGKDYDYNCGFIKHWIPPLRNIPNQLAHEPWLITKADQIKYGLQIGRDYPPPIVNYHNNIKIITKKIYDIRKNPEVKKISKEIFEKHGSRKKRQNTIRKSKTKDVKQKSFNF